ncbi:MAG: CPBP family intramembrane glutamic endopeptidase [Phenylobacterium sp.]
MSATLRVLKTVAIAAAAALAITAVGQGVWGALALVNAKVSPAIPWAPAVMLVLLPLLLGVLGGKIGPRAGAEARRALLPLKAVSGQVWVWSLIAGACGIAAIAFLWITLGELFPAAPNLLPDIGRMPRLTVLAFLGMGVVAAPLSEECAFRGYAMGMIRKVMPEGWALVLVSVMFALVHLTQGFYATKLLVYVLAGLMFGFTAWRAGSLIPAMVVHSAADLTFFTLVWPNDAHRPHVSLAAAGQEFWLQAAAALVLGALALAAYARLAQVTGGRGAAPLAGPALAVV